MASTMPQTVPAAHLLRSEIVGEALDADLRKAENRDVLAEICTAFNRARLSLGWSLKELTAAIERHTGKRRDERQVARWLDGTERPQLDSLFAVPELREPIVLALAALTDSIEVVVQFRAGRRRA